MPGQSLPLRAYVVTADGQRIDRTSSAAFSSSDPTKVAVIGNAACAMAPGSATLPPAWPVPIARARSPLRCLTSRLPKWSSIRRSCSLSVGDQTQLHIQGRAASGTYDLFPQRRFGGDHRRGRIPNRSAWWAPASCSAVSSGEAQVAATWRNSLHAVAAVTVTADSLGDLRIDPVAVTILPGQQILYTVTGMKGGQLRTLGPEDGLRLSVDNAQVRASHVGFDVWRRAGRRTYRRHRAG